MSNTIRYIVIGLFLLIGIGFLILTLRIDSIVSSGIEDIGSEMTGTPVTVGSVSISPFSGSGTISGFRVANPEGFSQEYAMDIESFSIELEPFSLFSNEIIVNDITVSGASVLVEQKMPENNIRQIMSNINSVSDGEASDSRLIIEHFTLENSTAQVYTNVSGERSASVDIPQIVLEDLGRESTMDTAEDVIKQIAEEVAGESLQAAVQGGLDQVRDAIQGLFD
jgi:hypothetical protein